MVVAIHPAFTHSDTKHDKDGAAASISPEEKSFGKQGAPKKVSYTITIDMNDTMRFGPDDLNIQQGETIKFVVKKRQDDEKHPGIEHDKPYIVKDMDLAVGKAGDSQAIRPYK